jgi:hypothetical protein
VTNAVQHMRRHIYPHGDIAAWGEGRPRISIIILGLTVVMALVALAAAVLGHLFAAA